MTTTPQSIPLPPVYRAAGDGPPCDLWLDGRAGLRWPDSPVPAVPHEAYPDTAPLEAEIADRWACEPTRVIVTAGADDALDRACGAYLAAGRIAVITDPTFTMLPRYTAMRGADVRQIPWPSGALPVDELTAAAGTGPGLIAVVTPNNPTGLVATAAELLDLARRCADKLLVVDLAYAEFADVDPTQVLLAEPNVLVVRTLSKAWGLAAARVGYALGAVAVIDALRAAGSPYPTAAASLAVARERWRTGADHVAVRSQRVRRERTRLQRLIAAYGLEAPASQANFVLARGPRAGWLATGLGGLGVSVRDLGPDGTRLSLPGEVAEFARLWQGCRTALAPEALLLDIDGVIADVGGSYRRAIIQTAASFGVAIDDARVAAAKAEPDSNNDWRITRRLLQQAGVEVSLDEVTARFEAIMQDQELWRRERLIPARAVLQRLAGRLPLAAVTGRPRADARRVLQQFEIADLFRTVVTLEDAPAKPDPAPVRLALHRLGVRRAWMVGDMPDDIAAARAAGVIPIGTVAPGDEATTSRPRLIAAGAAAVIDSLDQLEAWLP